MAKRSPNYVLVLLMLVVATGITYWARTRPLIVLAGADPASLPSHIGQWAREGKDWKPDKEVLDGWLIRPDNFLSRDYIGLDGTRATLMVVYKGADRRGWHLSEMCFSGSGFNVTQSVTIVPYAGHDASAVKLVAEDSSGTKQISVYLFAQGQRTESNFAKQQMAMALSRLRPSKDGWAFVRVTSQVVTSEEDTMKHIREFFGVVSIPLVKALTTSQKMQSFFIPSWRTRQRLQSDREGVLATMPPQRVASK